LPNGELLPLEDPNALGELPTAVLEFENEDELPVLVDVSADESC
jgi:hypothetical protein